MLGQAIPATRQPMLTRLKAVADHDPAAEVRTDAHQAIAAISSIRLGDVAVPGAHSQRN